MTDEVKCFIGSIIATLALNRIPHPDVHLIEYFLRGVFGGRMSAEGIIDCMDTYNQYLQEHNLTSEILVYMMRYRDEDLNNLKRALDAVLQDQNDEQWEDMLDFLEFDDGNTDTEN